jgi:dethiobiotin synthetase
MKSGPHTPNILFITGTDTDVGKTIFAAFATVLLRQQGVRVAALKPICSGGRDDARLLRNAAGKILPLDVVNPWHFHLALAPTLSARMEKKKVTLREVVAHIRRVSKPFQTVIIEGAGGLLSPMGEGFDSRDLILALRAKPIIVCINRLGAVNQIRVTLEALPEELRDVARIVLVSPEKPDAASQTNLKLLGDYLDVKRVWVMPRIGKRRGSGKR